MFDWRVTTSLVHRDIALKAGELLQPFRVDKMLRSREVSGESLGLRWWYSSVFELLRYFERVTTAHEDGPCVRLAPQKGSTASFALYPARQSKITSGNNGIDAQARLRLIEGVEENLPDTTGLDRRLLRRSLYQREDGKADYKNLQSNLQAHLLCRQFDL